MSLFIGLLAFDDPALQDRVKFGILAGSLIAGLAGHIVLRFSHRRSVGSLHRLTASGLKVGDFD